MLLMENKAVITENAMTLYKQRYLSGGETVDGLFRRVAGGDEEFISLMDEGLFLPNSPALFNMGLNNGCTSSACFVFNIEDCMHRNDDGSINDNSIVETRAKAIAVAKAGGGVGYYGGFLRAKNKPIKSVHRKACGPVAVLKDLHGVSHLITQGGKRELAQMFVLPVDHEDIMEFIHCKDQDPQGLGSFNISTSWKKGQFNDPKYKDVFENQVDSAWSHGCPGVFFEHWVNENNPNPHLGLMLAPNPSLRAGTRVLTDRGIFPIEELEGKDFNTPNLNCQMSDAKCFLSGRNKTLYKISLKGGRKVYATAEHKWPVLTKTSTEKVQTSELKKGQRLPINKLDRLPFGYKFSEEDGFFVGWVIADGGVTVRGDTGAKQISLILSQEKMKCGPGKRLIRYLESKNCNANFSKRERDGSVWYELHTQNAVLQKILDDSGFTTKEEGLPSSVWTSASEEFRKGMIDALISADGSVSVNNHRVRLQFCTSREKLATDMMDLLGFYGLHVSISTYRTDSIEFPNGKIYDRDYVRYDLSIKRCSHLRRFEKLFGLTHERKAKTLREMTDSKKVRWDDDCVEVESVTITDLKEDVWDVSVYDQTHCFTISGCVSGNCGETPNRNDEPCSLGSINLWRFVNLKTREFLWDKFHHACRIATRLLDSILDRNTFPHPNIDRAARLTRKLGLGVMGWADTLALLGIHYDTDEAVSMAATVMELVSHSAVSESKKLAHEKGPYPGFSWGQTKDDKRRNETNTSIAPTGTIAVLNNASGSIEPHFALEWTRTTAEGMKLQERIPVWEHLNGFKPKVANEIGYEWHIKHQAAFQRHTDLGVSKTINLPNHATKEDVANAYRMMHDMKCKGGTVFRDGCRDEQVLVAKKTKSVYSNGVEIPRLSEEVVEAVANWGGERNGDHKNSTHQSPPEKSKATKPGFIHRFRVDGSKYYLAVSTQDGRPYEMFITAKKAGSTTMGMLSTWAITFSKAMQSGVSLEKLCKAHLGSRFEPNGFTDDKEIPICTSVPDYVCKWLLKQFSNRDIKEVASTPDSGMFCPTCNSELMYVGGCLTCRCGWSKCG